jgi:AAA+ ATPase superfamily predicted ATPase
MEAVTRRTTSIVLLGQRRMGKTEIFKLAVNRLFFDQKHPADIHRSVVPVYYSFRK